MQASFISLVRKIALFLFVLDGLAETGLAQNVNIAGVVTDPSNAAVVSAQVTLIDNSTHAVRRAMTDRTGSYKFTSISPGVYMLTFEANNLSRYENAKLIVGVQDLNVNVQLQLSSISQSVTVTEDHESLQDVSTLDKTGTKLEDFPGSIQIISRQVLTQQGATMLRQGVFNASDVNYGGQDSKGFYDHFLVRGLNATIYSDGFTDGDQLGGVSHSLNGIERVEILEGPGSALFGSGAPGGTISLVHYTPSSDPHYGINLQGGSFGTILNNDYLTGSTGIAGLNYRIDATFSHSNGFRDLGSHDYEVRPSLEWQLPHHVLDFAVDTRHIHETPDSYGLIYLNGSPITKVAITSKYSTPFASAREPFIRPTLTDTWLVGNSLTISNRFSYLHRQLDAFGNGDSTSTKVSGGVVTGRQLRQQDDTDNSYDYQFEPVWKFSTGTMRHILLTGLEYLRQTLATTRTTADLPNIPDALHPVPPETSTAGLKFLCDAKHSCDNDRLLANYSSVYATEQVDVTNRLKLRAGLREDWFNTSLTPQNTVCTTGAVAAGAPCGEFGVPARFGTDGQPLLGGVPDTRHDAPVSWNAGVSYKVVPSAVPYLGVSNSHLANFNSENTQNGVGAPESALQYEAGIKFPLFHDRIALNTAAFNVVRNHVATLVTINGLETIVFDSQRTRGFEASFDGKPTEQWHILANVTTQDAVITDNPQGVTSVGNHPQGAPANMANLWSTYDFSIAGARGFTVGAGLNYMAKSYSDITNANFIPSFLIGNATFGFERESWSFRLNVDNFTDRRYFVAANAAGAYVGNPAAVYGQIRWNLGSGK